MTKTELKENIAKITQILQSENFEAGFELLRTKNDPALNEALSDLIQSTVKEKYFEPSYSSDPPDVDEGLDLLRILSPNITSLDLSGSYVEELDLSKFISLQELNCPPMERFWRLKKKMTKIMMIDF
jgi:hypothetical protein